MKDVLKLVAVLACMVLVGSAMGYAIAYALWKAGL